MISNLALANVVLDNSSITNNTIKLKENNTGTVKVNFPLYIVAI